MKKINAICFISLFFISACSMAPKHKQPELPISENWPNDPSFSINEEQKAADIHWQDFFLSSDIQTVINTTLENNRDLKEAALRIESARTLYRIKGSGLFPTLDGTVSGSRRHVSENSSSTGKDFISAQYDANLNTSFELDLFGRVRNLKAAALEEYFATSEARNALQVSLIAETANAYLQWLADNKILGLTKETLKIQTQSYELLKKSFENGIASKLDLLQSQSIVETAKVNVAVFTRRVALDKNALILLIGVEDKNMFLEGQKLENVKLAPELPVGLPASVLLLRPDVKSSEHQLKAMNANIGVARATFFPKISLTAAYGFSSSSLSTLFSGGSVGAWSFVPKITAPIFDAGNNKANLKYAKVQKEMAIVQYEKVIQTAFREVADELVSRQALNEQLLAQKNLIQTAQESYDLANSRYKNGIGRFINVLDSQRTLYNAQQNAVEIEKLLLNNLINLYKVLGGGWQENVPKELESKSHSHPHE